jgi:hypothetical protein
VYEVSVCLTCSSYIGESYLNVIPNTRQVCPLAIGVEVDLDYTVGDRLLEVAQP